MRPSARREGRFVAGGAEPQRSKRRKGKGVAVQYALYLQLRAMFDWDRDNLKRIKAREIDAAAVGEALSISPILIYEREADGKSRYVYYEGISTSA